MRSSGRYRRYTDPGPRDAWRRQLAAVLVGLSLSTGVALSHATAAPIEEYQVKAAYLFNFAKFVEWPASEDPDAIWICLLGADLFGEGLDRLGGRKVGARTVRVRRLGSDASGAANCNIVFISNSERDVLAAHLARLARWPVLTVSDIDGFLDVGGMIELRRVDANIKFAVNLAPADAVQLKVSSFLLQIAQNVRGR